MSSMDLAEHAKFLMDNLRLKTFPIGVKFLRELEEIPEKAKRPSLFLKKKITVCQGVTMARNYGWEVALTADDIICVPALLAFGMTPAPNAVAELSQLFCDISFKANKEVSVEEVKGMSLLEKDEFKAILLFPLAKASIEPDVIIIYGNPAQVSRLVQGATFSSPSRIEGSFGSKVECVEYLVDPLKSGEPRVIIPGLGDRIFSMTADDEMVFSFPLSWLDDLIQGLREAGKKIGARYPITHYQNFQPEFPKIYKDLAEKLGIS